MQRFPVMLVLFLKQMAAINEQQQWVFFSVTSDVIATSLYQMKKKNKTQRNKQNKWRTQKNELQTAHIK